MAKNTEVAVKKAFDFDNLPDTISPELEAQYQAEAGKGVSTDASDNLVPLIGILQALSPQVNKKDARYLDGAEAGDIWLKNSINPIVKGDDGIVFMPCYFYHNWVQWVPRSKGGGFAGQSLNRPDEAKQVEQWKWSLPNGNDVTEYRNQAGLVLTPDYDLLPYIIPFTSTGHTVARQWQTLQKQFRNADRSIRPCYARIYKLTLAQRTNLKGTWYQWAIGTSKATPEELVPIGRELCEGFEKQILQAAPDERPSSYEDNTIDKNSDDAPM
jgi:hypothetical protein